MPTEKNELFSSSDRKIELSREDFHALTGQLFGAYHKLDDALAHTLQMAGEMVRTASQSGLQPESGQLLFDDITSCLDTMVASRKQLVKAHRRAHVIRMRTTQAFEGCPPPYAAEPDNVISLASVG
jgi:hypothetical protein